MSRQIFAFLFAIPFASFAGGWGLTNRGVCIALDSRKASNAGALFVLS